MQSPWFLSLDSFLLWHWGQSTAKNSTGKQENLWVSKVWSKERWGLEQKRWSIAGRRQKMVRSVAGEGKSKQSDEPSRMLQLSLAWGCQLAQKHVLGLERTRLPLAQTVSSCLDRPFKEGTGARQCPRWASLGKDWICRAPAALTAVQQDTDYTSNFLFLFLGRLMILWQRGRFTEEWRREMGEVLDRFIFKKQCNIQEEMSRKELGTQDWRGNLWMICKSSN